MSRGPIDRFNRWVWFRGYRWMAFITGTTLLILTVVFILHKTLSDSAWTSSHLDILDRIVGLAHGVVLYPIYLITCVALARLARLTLWSLIAMLLAGFVPGLAFVMESIVARRLANVSYPGDHLEGAQ